MSTLKQNRQQLMNGQRKIMSNKPGGWQGAVFAPCFIRDQGLLCLAQRTEETMKKGRTHNKAVLKKVFSGLPYGISGTSVFVYQ